MKQSVLAAEKKLHVFIADDDLDDIEFFRRALEDISKDIKITVAGDGLELIEFIQLVTPDIIFLDINMPCMNGIDCLTEIRRLKKYDKIPVIIYSTTTAPKNIEKTYELGASMYFEKPVKFEKIKKRLTEILLLKTKDLFPQLPIDKYVVRG